MNKLILMTAMALSPAVASAATMSAATYVAKAGASDKYEMESSKLVLAETNDPKLKSYAQMMVDDHTKSTAEVVAAAKADGLTPPPPKLMPKQASMIAALRKTSGAKRDALYKKQQVVAHQETLVFQQAYARDGDKVHLKSVAGNIVPVVEHHLTEVKAMASAGAM